MGDQGPGTRDTPGRPFGRPLGTPQGDPSKPGTRVNAYPRVTPFSSTQIVPFLTPVLIMMNILRTRASIATRFTPRLCRMASNKLTAGSFVANFGANPDIRYTTSHEWIAVFDNKTGFIGITDYAAEALGDTTFAEVVETPADVEKEDSIGSVESVKSATDLYTPVSGQLVEGNEELTNDASIVNADPMGKAWFAKIELSKPEELKDLMTYEQYQEFLESDH